MMGEREVGNQFRPALGFIRFGRFAAFSVSVVVSRTIRSMRDEGW